MVGKEHVKKLKTRGPKKKKKTVSEDTVTLSDVVLLGGNKSDLSLIADVDDSAEVIDEFEKDLDADPVKHEEIRSLIKSLELYKYRNLSVVPDESDDSGDNEDAENIDKEKELEETTLAKEELKPVEAAVKSPDSPKKKKPKNKYKVQDAEVSSSSDVVRQLAHEKKTAKFDWNTHISSYKSRNHLLLKPTHRWYDEDKTETGEQTVETAMLDMERFASKLLADEVALYNKQREKRKKSDTKWLKTVLSSGTLSDKMAALTVLVGESPAHNLSNLDSLVNMAKKKGKREAMAAADALKELFLSDIIPSERKLKNFNQHSLSTLERLASGNKEMVDRTLMLWSFEAQLKERYTVFVKALDALSHDTLIAPKQKALGIVFHLLANKPEGEKSLLSMLVNKLGDPDYKIAAKASYLLTKLVSQHPNMNAVVVTAVETVLYRPNISKRAQYYAVCFLNQIVLDAEDEDLSAQLIKIYFSFFRAFLQQGEVDSKMMSALLTGVNRAYPYAKGVSGDLSEQLDHLYKIVHLVNFNTSLQALMLLQHVTDSSEHVSERYYMTLYKKLADPGLKTSSKQAMFLNLIFKTLRSDTSEKRIKAFIKRLLQVCAFHAPQFVCGVLFMLSEVIKRKPDIINFQQSYEESDDEEHFVDAPEEDEEEDAEDNAQKSKKQPASKKSKKSSWIHRRNKHEKRSLGTYDPFHRNPQYCGADQACVWELRKLANHFHPSVALFANNLLTKTHIVYTSDPLQDFTLIKFLDRFVYKNPKKREQVARSVMSSKQSVPRNQVPVDSEAFMQREESAIPADEKYLYKYFSQKSERGLERGKDDSDIESVSDGEFDAYLDEFDTAADDGEDIDGFDTDDTDMDFAGNFEKKRTTKKAKKGASAPDPDDEDDFDSDLDADLSDEELEYDSDEDDDDLAAEFRAEMEDAMGDAGGKAEFDEEDVEFSDEDGFMEKSSRKRRGDADDMDIKGKKKKKHKFSKDENLFAAAEEFSHLLEDNTGTSLDMLGGSHAVSNKDNSSAKQMKWESDREQWIRGQAWKNKRGGQKRGKMGAGGKGKMGGGRKQGGGGSKPKQKFKGKVKKGGKK